MMWKLVGVLLLFFFRRFFFAATEAEMDTERRPVCDAIVCRKWLSSSSCLAWKHMSSWVLRRRTVDTGSVHYQEYFIKSTIHGHAPIYSCERSWVHQFQSCEELTVFVTFRAHPKYLVPCTKS